MGDDRRRGPRRGHRCRAILVLKLPVPQFGHRNAPFAEAAKVSRDGGRTGYETGQVIGGWVDLNAMRSFKTEGRVRKLCVAATAAICVSLLCPVVAAQDAPQPARQEPPRQEPARQES